MLCLVLALISIRPPKFRVSIVRLPREPKSARVQGVEEGETSSAFFFRLGKKEMADRWVSALRSSDGVVYSDIDGIRRVLSSFYSSLFSAEDVDLAARDSLLGNLVSSLSPEQAETCEGPLKVAECHQALLGICLLYTSPSPRDLSTSRMPSSA